ncbi:ATP-binding protein [Thiomicrospira microaerophila]|uniref:hypothetical protein n=1 Tax=Thiomicrospira microaerophila TaxID=406020 RepID=UPI0005CA2E9C|nr:hypothetical protein [Thiomicrospira microaerophila]
MNEKSLRLLINENAIKKAHLIAQGGVFHIHIEATSNRYVIETADGNPRAWRTLDAAAKWLRKLGLGKACVDLTYWNPQQKSLL